MKVVQSLELKIKYMEKKGKITDLKPDSKNMNKHTEFGLGLLEKSVRNNKFGRSILVDKDNNVIAGNGILETAVNIGAENIRIIETTGDELVVVKRTDVSLDSKQGREMALADNATSAADLAWDVEKINEVANEWGLVPNEWGVHTWEEPDVDVENTLPDELQGLDITPDALDDIQGDDEVEYERIIIVYKGQEEKDMLCAMLGLDDIKKVVYKLEELTQK